MTLPLADASDMFVVHTMFRREFGSVPGLVRGVAAGDERRAEVVAGHVALINGVLHHHHAGEDAHVWPRLLERVPEKLKPLVAVMEEQHEAIHKSSRQLGDALEAWRATASAQARDALAETVEQLLPALTEHLALEEEHVVPLIEQYVTAEEYRRLTEEGSADTPPDQLPTIFGMLMYEGEPQAIDRIVSEMPPEIQPVIKDLAAKAYAAYAAELYGTATPPRVTG
ncbi:hemerythrin domain-containing protein [Nonomuraea terrae]|uniref:hemerythrin domain-containing protein n=1 Tax=Nonomuraea terrae TaxID=2530383 RepID=UPI00379A9EFA